MKWPFARQSHTSSTASLEGSHVEAESHAHDIVVAPSRRDWMALPPLHVAGGRAINLTTASREFTQGLASRQNIAQSTTRLEHVRHLESPSGSFRGILSPSVSDHGGAAMPELQEPSALPSVEHRQLGAVRSDSGRGLSPIEQLLAIGETPTGDAPTEPTPPPIDVDVDSAPRRRMGLGDSRRHGLGPAYHGTLPEAMRAERQRTVESVPSDLRATMRDVLGVDVGDRLVHRGPAVSAEAQAIGAHAFTRDGEVYVSDDVGPLDQARGRAALAHELTHAAQQELHGNAPDEASAHGQAMEAHAQQVEQYVRGDASAGKPSPDMLHAKPGQDAGDAAMIASTRKMMRELVDTGLARSDGAGGIVFTMPPSSMMGTQRLAGDTPHAGTQPGAAARQENWSGLSVFGNTLAQGLGNDLLGIAGSVFGFSDEFMGEQRGAMADADREFRRQQTQQAFVELRMEHLRTAELQRVNREQVMAGHEQFTSLDQATLDRIEHEVQQEVNRRLQLLENKREPALEQVNQHRASAQQAALDRLPDENYDTAFHRMFDDPEHDEQLPTEDQILALMAAVTGGGTTPHPGGATTPHPPGATGGTPTAHPTGPPTAHATGTPTATGTGTGTHTGTGTGTTGTGTGTGGPPGSGTGTHTPGTGAGTEHHEEAWRTAPTMRGRFEGLGNALTEDIANAELGFFGSVLGFDTAFENTLHSQVHAGSTTAAGGGATGATTPATHTPPAHADAAHAGTAPDAHGAAHAPASHSGSQAHQQVDHIVSDPYALDELANRLYPNIRTRLRQELLIDRERAGLLADFR